MVDLFEQANINIENKTIKKVVLENYRNFSYHEILFDTEGNILTGKNGIGKTNIIEAIYWVLSGRLFSGLQQNHMIGVTPITAEKGTKTKVKIEFNNGFIVEKVFWEKWTDETYNGTDNAYYINGSLEKKVSSAERAIHRQLGLEEISTSYNDTKLKDMDLIALFYSVNYLQNIDYKLLRLLITDIVGEIDFKSIISENASKYGRLVAPLKQHALSLENLKEATRIAKFGHKTQEGVLDMIKGIKSTIETLQKEANESVDETKIVTSRNKIKELTEEMTGLQIKLRQGVESIVAEIRNKINEKQIRFNELKDETREAHAKEVKKYREMLENPELKSKEKSYEELRNKRIDINEEVSNMQNNLSQLNSTQKVKQQEMSNQNETRQNLLNDWKKAKAPQENDEQITCPHCSQTFDISSCKEHQTLIYERIEKINKQGQNVKTKIEELTEGLATLKIEIDKLELNLVKKQEARNQIDKNMSTLKTEIDELRLNTSNNAFGEPTIDFNTKDIQSIVSEIKTLENERDGIEINLATQQQKDKARIMDIEMEIDQLTQITNADTTKKAYLNTIQKEQEKLSNLKIKLNDLDDISTLIKEVERETFERLDVKLATAFGENFYFQLYKINIDETVDTRMCEMFVKDKWNNFVNVKNINKGMLPVRVMEFISKIKNHYSIEKSFVFVDEINNLDTEHRKMLLNFGEQIIATDKSDSEKMIKEKI